MLLVVWLWRYLKEEEGKERDKRRGESGDQSHKEQSASHADCVDFKKIINQSSINFRPNIPQNLTFKLLSLKMIKSLI